MARITLAPLACLAFNVSPAVSAEDFYKGKTVRSIVGKALADTLNIRRSANE